jgi:hypothetical protein
MRIITGLLQFLAVAVLAVGAFLLVIDPRLLDLVEQDLSQLTQGTLPGGKSTTSQPGKGGSNPTGEEGNSSDKNSITTENGYTISRRCVLWSVEGLDLYYSPVNPAAVCVQPPGSGTLAGSPFVPGITQMPASCAAAPDGKIYCLAGGELTPDTLAGLYGRGELAP